MSWNYTHIHCLLSSSEIWWKGNNLDLILRVVYVHIMGRKLFISRKNLKYSFRRSCVRKKNRKNIDRLPYLTWIVLDWCNEGVDTLIERKTLYFTSNSHRNHPRPIIIFENVGGYNFRSTNLLDSSYRCIALESHDVGFSRRSLKNNSVSSIF